MLLLLLFAGVFAKLVGDTFLLDEGLNIALLFLLLLLVGVAPLLLLIIWLCFSVNIVFFAVIVIVGVGVDNYADTGLVPKKSSSLFVGVADAVVVAPVYVELEWDRYGVRRLIYYPDT